MEGERPRRKPLRLKTFDYGAPGTYFLTVCTDQKRCTLAAIRRGDPCGRPIHSLTPLGEAVKDAIGQTAKLYDVYIDRSVIMPNHFHLLVTIPNQTLRATARVAPTTGLIVGAIKSIATNNYLKTQCKRLGPLWQRGYHDHVIRDEADYLRVWTYMDENPAHWLEDCYYTKER